MQSLPSCPEPGEGLAVPNTVVLTEICNFRQCVAECDSDPKGIHTYQDIVRTGAKLVTGAGFNTVEAARKEGVPDDQMMLVAGEVEILAAMNAGRADAAVETFFGAKEHVDKSNGKFEVTDPAKLPKWTQNWVGIGMRKSDTDFLAAFNEAMAKVIGGEKWMAAVEPCGYTKFQLPGPDSSTPTRP